MSLPFSVVVPAHNEAFTLTDALEILVRYLNQQPVETELILVENGSSDETWCRAQDFERKHAHVRAIQSPLGKGAAILAGWKVAQHPIVVFIDADLSPSLETIPHLVAEVERTGGCVVADRFLRTSHVTRSWSRRCLSFGWALVASLLLPLPFMDYQCGAKAIPASWVPWIDEETSIRDWGFDLECLCWVWRQGLGITRVPTTWVESRFPERVSHVPILRTSLKFLRQVLQLRKNWSLESR